MKKIIEKNFTKNVEIRYDLLHRENKNEAEVIKKKEQKNEEMEEKLSSSVFEENVSLNFIE